jgi:hypothetical protein
MLHVRATVGGGGLEIEMLNSMSMGGMLEIPVAPRVKLD